ncbi:hypothetical protein [Allorhizocola rhizosphaerae]|uniref:hypothetical protein n=1 Tax=Allorhizocola rhizosphaerae TaxID=1872709 RepID=UPI000E3C777A|nr:hypothetical protein [Allorhizocola rhizosphaerae]
MNTPHRPVSPEEIPEPEPEREPDFAEEHQDLTVGDGERGGPEHKPERESPKGYGGADLHRSLFSQF